MKGGDYISVARKRAGLTQRELAQRLGCRQATIARWERDDRHPSLEETQAAVRACGFDLAVNLVAEDRSWWPQIALQLERPPVERLRSLAPPGAPALVPALEVLSEIKTPAIVIGEVAGALHGWPLVLSGTGTVEVCGEPDKLAPQLLANGLKRSGELYVLAAGPRISIVEEPPGATGARDLARGAETIELPIGSVQVAGVLDLLRIADAADGGRRSRETLALQAVLEVERARAAAAPVIASDEERRLPGTRSEPKSGPSSHGPTPTGAWARSGLAIQSSDAAPIETDRTSPPSAEAQARRDHRLKIKAIVSGIGRRLML